MTNLEFQEILRKLEQGMTPELTNVVERAPLRQLR